MMTNCNQHYEQWRQLWLSGGRSQAVTVMIYHGLYKALMVTVTVASTPPAAVKPLPEHLDTAVNEPAIAIAAQCVRRLLSPQLSIHPSWRAM